MAAAEVVDPNRLSYDRGPSAPSLLESTIGANLAATAAMDIGKHSWTWWPGDGSITANC
ncbi:fatty-acid-CoA ligase [Mycobacterium tuberculosis]|uniref:Fatty-acid-CoA ligase n=1 Tax=Mycobacterium tuberculosis TaxID=1773 RepID=A0A655AKA4_MYCTX|nr:fatty-acid-CoA ligase [Mycobacterium tuberculosis]CFH17935.1 fatty-acid-CoA ligase [Mycobacterium tuberculosis]CFH31040.1 fatty-acid-CoA ligase [Mycobacterium tuberculosis]CKM67321.1 fatty-acid-CoA ligase [Mycobacterium tuberculosis]CKM85753.1 fatty-acid-CoA ligase [Mycobacterium tuberculosis]